MEPSAFTSPANPPLDRAAWNTQSICEFNCKSSTRHKPTTDVRPQGGARNMAIRLKVNGAARSVPAEPDTPLLYVLRNDFELNGAKFGCGLAQCGACTVLVNGQATRSCVTPIDSLAGAEIVTLEGLGTVEKPHVLQRAFIAEQA